MKDPKITILMPVYNGEKFLRPAIDSMLTQTFKDFELLIIDDGSTDRSHDIISSYSDPRIRSIQLPKNLGLREVLNQGIRLSKTDLIARIDCDDISLPQRLEIQVAFMEQHPGVAVVGSWVSLIDKKGKETGVKWKNHTDPEEIRAQLLFHNCIAHPSTILRKSLLPEGLFDPGLTPAEDYDLWIRTSKNEQIMNIDEVLLLYRVHGSNMSSVQIKKKDDAINKIITDQLSTLEINPTDEDLKIHRKNYGYCGDDPLLFLDQREKWLKKIKEQNDIVKYYEQRSFNSVLAERWLSSASSNANLGFIVWKKFWKSPLIKNLRLSSGKEVLKFFIKCLLKRSPNI